MSSADRHTADRHTGGSHIADHQVGKHPGGRRKGGASSREAIIEAAIAVFADQGYENATLRAITAKAGVDVALVSHFFGGKQGLFEEAVVYRAERNLQAVLAADFSEQPARRLLETYLAMWEDPATALTVKAVVRAALESETMREQLQGRVSEHLRAALMAMAAQRGQQALDDTRRNREQMEARSALLGAHLLGIGVSRYILRLEPIATLRGEDLVESLVPVIERYLPASYR